MRKTTLNLLSASNESYDLCRFRMQDALMWSKKKNCRSAYDSLYEAWRLFGAAEAQAETAEMHAKPNDLADVDFEFIVNELHVERKRTKIALGLATNDIRMRCPTIYFQRRG
jgi:hypothetical protein